MGTGCRLQEQEQETEQLGLWMDGVSEYRP